MGDLPLTDDAPLSPYIAESIRERRRREELERGQREAIRLAAAAAGVSLSMAATDAGLEFLARSVRRVQRARTHGLASSAKRRARLSEATVELVSRSSVIARDGKVCYLCLRPVDDANIHLDHVIPLSRGGAHTMGNLRVACAPCNLAKGSLTADEFLSVRLAS